MLQTVLNNYKTAKELKLTAKLQSNWQIAHVTFTPTGKLENLPDKPEDTTDFDRALILEAAIANKKLPYSYCTDLKVSTDFDIKLPKSKNTFLDFLGNDESRPYFTGVYHDNGYKIALDGHRMAVIKSEYPAEYEGKIIRKSGFIIDEKYPNYKGAIPYREDTQKVELLPLAIQLTKLSRIAKNFAPKWQNVSKGEGTYNVNLLLSCVKVLIEQGHTHADINTPTANRELCFWAGDDTTLVMPIFTDQIVGTC